MSFSTNQIDTQTLQIELVEDLIRELSLEEGLFEALHSLLEFLHDRFPRARIFAAGGIVRDLAVCRCENLPFRLHDLDLVAEGIDPLELGSVLDEFTRKSTLVEYVRQVGKSFPVWKIKASGYHEPIDLALTRTEWSFGGHHRDFNVSTDGVTIEEDSLRRDFRMNALFIELQSHPERKLSGRLHDFNEGLESILARRIESVGDPCQRFREDPLRMLRAIRFRAKLPGFEIGSETSAAMVQLIPELLKTVSGERIAEEVFKASRSGQQIFAPPFKVVQTRPMSSEVY